MNTKIETDEVRRGRRVIYARAPPAHPVHIPYLMCTLHNPTDPLLRSRHIPPYFLPHPHPPGSTPLARVIFPTVTETSVAPAPVPVPAHAHALSFAPFSSSPPLPSIHPAAAASRESHPPSPF